MTTLTRTSDKELIAPGADAVLATVFYRFLHRPAVPHGDPAGDIARDCLATILSSNAGGAWDTSHKLCESLKLKVTEQV